MSLGKSLNTEASVSPLANVHSHKPIHSSFQPPTWDQHFNEKWYFDVTPYPMILCIYHKAWFYHQLVTTYLKKKMKTSLHNKTLMEMLRELEFTYKNQVAKRFSCCFTPASAVLCMKKMSSSWNASDSAWVGSASNRGIYIFPQSQENKLSVACCFDISTICWISSFLNVLNRNMKYE